MIIREIRRTLVSADPRCASPCLADTSPNGGKGLRKVAENTGIARSQEPPVQFKVMQTTLSKGASLFYEFLARRAQN